MIAEATLLFHAGEVGYFAPAEGSSDYTLVVVFPLGELGEDLNP